MILDELLVDVDGLDHLVDAHGLLKFLVCLCKNSFFSVANSSFTAAFGQETTRCKENPSARAAEPLYFVRTVLKDVLFKSILLVGIQLDSPYNLIQVVLSHDMLLISNDCRCDVVVLGLEDVEQVGDDHDDRAQTSNLG